MPHMGEYSKARAIADQFCRIKTGVYTGDGTTSQAITGIGFQPKFVWIHAKLAAFATTDNFTKTDQHAGDFSTILGAAFYDAIDNRVISLDSDGFTVDDDGSDANPNTLNQVYMYMALG